MDINKLTGIVVDLCVKIHSRIELMKDGIHRVFNNFGKETL
jgi:hypothetical protein